MTRKPKPIGLILNWNYFAQFLETQKIDANDYSMIAEKLGIDRSHIWRLSRGEGGPGPEFIAAVKLTYPAIDLNKLITPFNNSPAPENGNKAKETPTRSRVAPSHALSSMEQRSSKRIPITLFNADEATVTQIAQEQSASIPAVVAYLVQKGLKHYKPGETVPDRYKMKRRRQDKAPKVLP